MWSNLYLGKFTYTSLYHLVQVNKNLVREGRERMEKEYFKY